MEWRKHPVDLPELSGSQKTEFLKHVSAYLKQRSEEERYGSISLSNLGKDYMGLEFNLTIEGAHEMSAIKSTIEKIENLEAEKKSLLLEIDELKKMADAKATALEGEVNALREEVRSLKVLMHKSELSVDRKLKK
jgi:uncharacterized protein (UPF0335 family)